MQPQQPIQPIQQPQQQPTNFDFTQQQQPQVPVPPAPAAPTPDPTITQLQNDISEIKTAIGGLTPAQPDTPEAPTEQPKQTYDEWGAVFTDVEKLVDSKLEAQQAQNQEVNQQVQAQEAQNQQYIDNTIGQLRTAGYLPPVVNQFDTNDVGKQAENELLGYTLSLGSTDLVSAARELKFRHDAGYKYDYQTKGFVQVNQPNQNEPNGNMFGNLPQTPDGQVPQIGPQNFAPVQPMGPQQPVGPQNPYMQPQYPAGFNAPVSSGNSYQGTQGSTPALRNIRASSYDALVDQFNRTN